MNTHFALNSLTTFLCATVLLALSPISAKAEQIPVSLATALDGKQLVAEATGNGRDQLSLTLRNPSAKSMTVTIPAGLIAEGRNTTDRVVLLRKADATVPAQGVVDVSLPVVALSSKSGGATQPFILTAATEPKLTPLLDYLATQPDAPRGTAQLAVFCLLENMSYGQWIQFLSASSDESKSTAAHPTPAEITQAVDVLGLLRQVAPQQTLALASDSELKLRALRNPWCRVKAMQIYGLNLGDGAVPPDLGQLLHTKPGDNCPICRQRALLQQSQNDL
jgi:hypothetical protein